ncbi:E3 ubiquitin-protein ligase ZNRF1 [Pseudolycoriella hygida]|uniref:E3 ubiquitin-protein ligase ZNRF1 n=1 Tax=Pseudolycoriella hygida TaxID=35572 RepID=A0A9Q0MX47_9DIPT|nr:E3 ubiquitin-protein ligase ZNRF1 [Pseudolycoriella hygida]
MGAKPSTANGGHQGSRERAFSTSMHTTNDRQRARSLSSVPDLQASHNNHEAMSIPPNGGSSSYAVATQSGSHEDNPNVNAIALGRFTATSLPSHIWSWNGIKCPVCSKFVLPDDIECHLVMCLTKPRLSYNEDVLNDAKGECVICLDDLNAGDVIARLPCLCIYHKGCIDKWFEVNRCCPEHPGD